MEEKKIQGKIGEKVERKENQGRKRNLYEGR